jgi:DNA-binding NarL/FixJ family response regulator
MADPIDDLEAMIQSALESAQAVGCMPHVRNSIIQWRQQYGGEVYIGKRKHLSRHEEIFRLIESGLSSSEIAERVGLTRQAVHNVKRSRRSSSIL